MSHANSTACVISVRFIIATLDDVPPSLYVQVGQVLHGVVRNVTPFGAFVDVGLKEDGLLHVSELSWQVHLFVAAVDPPLCRSPLV